MTTALEGVRGQRHAPAPLYPGKDPVPIVQEAGWAPGPVWTGGVNLDPTGGSSGDSKSCILETIQNQKHVHMNVFLSH
jgi:hypothetical protein